MRVFLHGLAGGQIPLYKLAEPTLGYVLQDGHWDPRPSRQRFLVPLADGVLTAVLEKLRESLPEDTKAIIIASRGVWLDDFIHFGIGLLPHTGVEAPHPFDVELVDGRLPEDAIQLIERFTRLTTLSEAPDHPILRAIWEEDREEAWRNQLLRDEDRAARERANELLVGFLDETQMQELAEHQYFHVIGEDGETYRVHDAGARNIFLMRDGKPHTNYCIVFTDRLPKHDLLLAQKVLLERDIMRFLKTAHTVVLEPDEVEPMLDQGVVRRMLSGMELRETLDRLLEIRQLEADIFEELASEPV